MQYMDKRSEFNEALSALIELAAANGNTLSTAQIQDAFHGILTDESMLEHVFSYLMENKIHITGYIPPLSESLSEADSADAEGPKEFKTPKENVSPKEVETSKESVSPDKNVSDTATEQAYIQMYLTELEDILPLTPQEETELLRQSMEQDLAAKDKLVELNLKLVIEECQNFKGKGVPTSDLIQEGNLGLLEGVATYDGNIDLPSFHRHLRIHIQQALQNALDEEIGAERIGRHLADRANALSHFSTEFAKEHEREATIEELAAGMGLSEDEIRNIIKYSLDALNSTGEED